MQKVGDNLIGTGSDGNFGNTRSSDIFVSEQKMTERVKKIWEYISSLK